MQDIDFGRFYRQNSQHRRVRLSDITHEKKKHYWAISRNTLWVFTALVLFFAGLILGTHWERYQYSRQIEKNTLESDITTANIAPPQVKEHHELSHSEKNDKLLAEPAKEKKVVSVQEQVEHALKNSKEAYLILAKIYTEEKDAYLHGRELKKQGLPVFLARSGKKIKVYVGPIEGKNAAYQQLAIVKNYPEFRNAIMYKK